MPLAFPMPSDTREKLTSGNSEWKEIVVKYLILPNFRKTYHIKTHDHVKLYSYIAAEPDHHYVLFSILLNSLVYSAHFLKYWAYIPFKTMVGPGKTVISDGYIGVYACFPLLLSSWLSRCLGSIPHHILTPVIFLAQDLKNFQNSEASRYGKWEEQLG